jgi:hypothetical protein
MPKLRLSRVSVSAPFLGAELDDAAAAEAADAADDDGVLAKGPVASERHELGDQPGDAVGAMRPLRVTRQGAGGTDMTSRGCLNAAGRQVLIVWEREVRDLERLRLKLELFLGPR